MAISKPNTTEMFMGRSLVSDNLGLVTVVNKDGSSTGMKFPNLTWARDTIRLSCGGR